MSNNFSINNETYHNYMTTLPDKVKIAEDKNTLEEFFDNFKSNDSVENKADSNDIKSIIEQQECKGFLDEAKTDSSSDKILEYLGKSDDGKVSTFEAENYAKGESEIQEEVDKRMVIYMSQTVYRFNQDGSDPIEQHRAAIEKEVRLEYAENHPFYKSAQNDCQGAVDEFEEYKNNELAKWEEENPAPKQQDPWVLMSGPLESQETKEYEAKKAEFLADLEATYAENNPDYGEILEAKAKYAAVKEIENEASGKIRYM